MAQRSDQYSKREMQTRFDAALRGFRHVDPNANALCAGHDIVKSHEAATHFAPHIKQFPKWAAEKFSDEPCAGRAN